MLRRVYPWLLPAVVALMLVLSFGMAERLRRNTPEGKFNRIKLGMDRDTVRHILGERTPDKELIRLGPQLITDQWVFDGFCITIHYSYWDLTVASKSMDCDGE